jgi:hypothetical protein
VRVIESLTASKDGGATSGDDRLVVTRDYVAVIDGSSRKPGDRRTGPRMESGSDIATTLERVIRHLPQSASADQTVDLLTEATRQATRGRIEADACATVAILSARRREVWRVGDPWVMIDGAVHAPHRGIERLLSWARRKVDALYLKLRPRCDLTTRDPGREAIGPLLRRLHLFRNRNLPGSVWAIDGRPIPSAGVEVFLLAKGATEVVLATDGYPVIASTLALTEQRLSRILDMDPYMIRLYPQTKGRTSPSGSFDDRTYVRVLVPD